jgi:uncharacterized membrane protein
MRSSRLWLIAAALALTAVTLFSCSGKPTYPEARTSVGEIRFAVDALRDGEPEFRSLVHEGKRIDYLVLKINGRVESYFDACAKCYPKKLGYRKDGDYLKCVACGQRYPLEDLGGIGSCYPLKLRGRVVGDSYVIEKADVVKGLRYF